MLKTPGGDRLAYPLRRVMAAIGTAVLAAGLLIPAGEAPAATVRFVSSSPNVKISSFQVLFQAAPGEVNRVNQRAEFPGDPESGHQVYTFTGAPTPRVGAGSGRTCRAASGGVVCSLINDTETAWVRVLLGDRNDVAQSGGGLTTIYGQTGNDAIRGDMLDGGSGNDVLRATTTGAGEPSELTGGLGHDRLYGGTSRADSALYAARRTSVRVDLRRAGPQGSVGERDFLYGVENVKTGFGGDTLTGNALPNVFTTGSGSDMINIAGGGRDTAFCGRGTDTVRADRQDRLVGCERVTRVG